MRQLFSVGNGVLLDLPLYRVFNLIQAKVLSIKFKTEGFQGLQTYLIFNKTYISEVCLLMGLNLRARSIHTSTTQNAYGKRMLFGIVHTSHIRSFVRNFRLHEEVQ
jgi:hypothetical protein